MLGLIPTLAVLGMTSAPHLLEFLRAESSYSSFYLFLVYYYSVIFLSAHLTTFISVIVSWAVPLIAVACGAGIAFLGNLLVWIMFAIGAIGVSSGAGGGDHIFYAWTILVICGNLILVGVIHFGIGQQLLAKGAQS